MVVESKANCIGFVTSHFAITEDTYIDPNNAMVIFRPWFELVEERQAQVVMVYSPESSYVTHMALIDPINRFLVVHRPGCGEGVIKDTKDLAVLWQYRSHLQSGHYQLGYLKFLGEQPNDFPKVRRSLNSFVPRLVRIAALSLWGEEDYSLDIDNTFQKS